MVLEFCFSQYVKQCFNSVLLPEQPTDKQFRDYNTEQDTILNGILRTLKHKRRPIPHNDPTMAVEKGILRKRHRDAIEYLETCGRGLAGATNQEAQTGESVVRNLLEVLED